MPVQLLDVPDKIDKSDFVLKWKKTDDNGASITTYTVYQRIANGNGQELAWKAIHSSLTYSYHVLSLERCKVYEFKVTATNTIGEGKDGKGHFKTVKVEAGK